MKIVVAGAGAGKTTSMAEEVLKRYKALEDGKIMYVITYTNAARDHIRNKVIEQHGSLPNQIKVETSHVFLLQEIIFPFHHLLYGQFYSKISSINLSSNHIYRAQKIKELAVQNIIHVEEVNKVARFVINGKSNDRKLVKDKRIKVLSILKKYLDSIFIDEAQDMDTELAKIVEILYANEFFLHIVGDPKQDLRGRNELRRLIGEYPQFVEYKKENYRCPISHVNLSNKYVPEEEQQEHRIAHEGYIRHLFENDIDVPKFLEQEAFNHIYIYQKNDRFFTNSKDRTGPKNLLEYELKLLIKKSKFAEEHTEKINYVLCKWIRNNISEKNNWKIINKVSEVLQLNFTKADMGRLYAALDLNRESEQGEAIIVNSIDHVKGLEGSKCLFILTTELSEYFFKNKVDQNKMLNYLYVALTRATQELVILITKEVEEKFKKSWIENTLLTLF
ncbi:UvrD-helicase domain-containing protein [Bacillus cereus group sp. BfR-BA-01330]|uniref:UvrD-helicase domain-containing protein n=1 Tax=Bacillus cereus group sp. BfR-BA-01330 TaxID=2920306 RepID=UPI001F56B07F